MVLQVCSMPQILPQIFSEKKVLSLFGAFIHSKVVTESFKMLFLVSNEIRSIIFCFMRLSLTTCLFTQLQFQKYILKKYILQSDFENAAFPAQITFIPIYSFAFFSLEP